METKKKINVAFFVDNFSVIDGVVMVIKQYAKRLKDRANVFVVCPKSKKTQMEEDYQVIFASSIHVPFIGYDIGSPFGRRKFYRDMKKRDIDIVHFHSPFMLGEMAVKVAKMKQIPLIATFHSQIKRDFEMTFKFKFISNIVLKHTMRLYNACDEVWAVNANVEKLLPQYGYKGRTRVMDNATEMFPLENPELGKKEVNEKFGYTEKDRVLLFLGRITSQKNIYFTEEVIKNLRDRGFDFKFLFVGDGYSMLKIKSKVSRHKLNDIVTFAGSISDRNLVAKIYARADLFVFPSYYDTDGLVKYEAAAQGTPVIFGEGAIAAGGIEEGVNGFFGKPDVVAFADKIIQIFEDKEAYRRVCDNLATKLYRTWDGQVDLAFKRYNELIEKNKQKLEEKTSV